MVVEQLTGYLAERSRIAAAERPGTASARELAARTDEAVSALAGTASALAATPFAILALGGYGARRLLPHSDIDLLIVSTAPPARLESLVRALIYPLWDAGLAVGHQVRSPSDQAAAVREDTRILTAFLTARMVCGDAGLAEQTLSRTFQSVNRHARRIRSALLRRERPGSPYLLVPDLKESAGGQRDLDEFVWHAAVLTGGPQADPGALVAAGALTAAELDALHTAQDDVTAARWRLHRAAGRGQNVLGPDDAEAARIDADAAQRALETVHHTLLAVRARLGREPRPSVGSLGLPDLVRAAERGPAALPALERAAWFGGLEDLAPGFGRLMSLRRPALSHRYTVGAHCLRTLTLLARPGADGDPVPLGRHGPALALAALVHDAGKRAAGPGHAERGSVMAYESATRAGLGDADARVAATLVREHLLLTEVATHCDLSEEDVVLRTAPRLGDPSLVRPLFLLTAADMQATSPDVWDSWRAALVGDLAVKLEVALSPDTDGAGILRAAESTRAQVVRDAQAVGASRSVIAFAEQAPLRYLATRSSAEVLHDARLVSSIAGPGPTGRVAFGVTAGRAEHTWTVDIVTRDRPGLFARLTGVLALAGLDVLSAEAFTAHGGIAIDTFVVSSATLAPVDPSTWAALERLLGAVARDALDLETRLAERRRHYPAPACTPIRAPMIDIGERGVYTTPVRVRASDRVGLLHDLALTIEREGFEIRHAVAATDAGVADDTFDLIDAEGAPPRPDVLRASLTCPLTNAANAV